MKPIRYGVPHPDDTDDGAIGTARASLRADGFDALADEIAGDEETILRPHYLPTDHGPTGRTLPVPGDIVHHAALGPVRCGIVRAVIPATAEAVIAWTGYPRLTSTPYADLVSHTEHQQ